MSKIDYLGWYVLEADGNRDRTALVDDNEEWAKFQVIGNIHDNPELVEV